VPVEDLDTRVLLIGDAGGAGRDDVVLRALRSEIAEAPERTVVLFLGDNLYPHGLSAPGDAHRPGEEARLDAQLDAVRGSGARTLFLPGNHDWENGGSGGWDAIVRQEEYVVRHGDEGVGWVPGGGCPGPVVEDVASRVRLVALDTQWWLHSGPRPLHPSSSCPVDSEPEVVEALRQAIATAGERRVVVAAHHPLETGGPHGGHFGWRGHLFPLTALQSWLWLPLPGIGSLYPIARRSGITDQDLSGSKNRHMRDAIEGVFAERPPLVFAAGHEHSLQVLEGEPVPWLLVSGAGYFDHLSPVSWTEQTRFAAEASGFMRLDVGRSGRTRLGVFVVDASGRSREAFAQDLEPGGVPRGD